MPMYLLIPWLVSFLAAPVLAKIDNERLNLVQYAYGQAVENNIDPKKFVRLMACESRLDASVKGDWSEEKKEFMANGIIQFWKGTFYHYAPKYGMDGADYLDPYDQTTLASVMIHDGMWYKWWNCATIVGYSKKKPY